MNREESIQAFAKRGVIIHESSYVDHRAEIGEGTRIWLMCQVREGSIIGRNVTVSKNVYIDAGARIGNNVKIQNNVSVYSGVTIEDGVMVGPHVCFTNDMKPRAIGPDGNFKSATDWKIVPTLIKYGAALSANATIVCGVTVGAWSMVGSGAVVTRDVPAYGLVVGNPARLIGYVCPCGASFTRISSTEFYCRVCDKNYPVIR